MLKQLIKTIGDYVQKQNHHPTRNHKICFVVSAPRSGSTWLKTALNHHPEIFCTENRLFGRFCEIWPNNDGTRTPRITLDKYLETLAGHYDFNAMGLSRNEFIQSLMDEYIETLIRFSYRYSKKSVLVDKVTPYIDTADLVIKSIKHYFPDASIIQLIRDGRDVLTSGAFDWLLKNGQGKPAYDYFIKGETDKKLERFFYDEDIELWTKYWTQPIEAVRTLQEGTLTIRYEEMLKDQGDVLVELFKHINVDSSSGTVAGCIEEASFEKMSAGRKRGQEDPTAKVRKGISGEWTRYFTRRDGEIFHRCAGTLLIQSGYEKDGSWVSSLPGSLGCNSAI
jgi:hypothetical protein